MQVRQQERSAGSEVTGEVTQDATVKGLDEYGFLLVETVGTEAREGQRLSLQPDGNSFDMMKGLITFKTQ